MFPLGEAGPSWGKEGRGRGKELLSCWASGARGEMSPLTEASRNSPGSQGLGSGGRRPGVQGCLFSFFLGVRWRERKWRAASDGGGGLRE